MSILIVDDSKSIRTFLKQEIEGGGYQTIFAVDGKDAFLKWEENRQEIELITLDINMPEMDGFAVCAKIRKYEQDYNIEKSVPIVFMTGSDSPNERVLGFDAGASEFLSKTFRKGELRILIDSILNPNNRWAGLNVLIADEMRTVRRIVADILKPMGVNIFEAANGKLAYQMMLESPNKFHMVISGLHMPEMGGQELCDLIRKNMGLKTIPILFLSADQDSSSILSLYKSGATDFILKPFIKENFLARVTTHFENSRLLNNLQKNISELEGLNKLKDKFLAVCSHDLRNPLNAINGYTELVIDAPQLQGTEYLEYLNSTLRCSKQLNDYIEDLLDLGKMQMQGELKLERTNLMEVVQECFNNGKMNAANKNLRCILQAENCENLYLQSNKNSLMRVINNLLTNAIKFTPSQKSVTLSIEPSPGQVAISVTDEGTGMDDDIMKNLFKGKMVEGKKGTAGEGSTGIGLNIVHELVTKLSGKIFVSSKLGQGSKFWIEFPLEG